MNEAHASIGHWCFVIGHSSFMQIAAIETHPVRVPLKPAYRMISALGRHDESQFVLLKLLTDTGLEGAGEATATVRWSGETEDDVAGVRAVREVIGFDRKLVMDANCGWDADTAIRCIRALKDCRIDLVEQPTPDGDYEQIARVRRECGLPVMADDMCFNL